MHYNILMLNIFFRSKLVRRTPFSLVQTRWLLLNLVQLYSFIKQI